MNRTEHLLTIIAEECAEVAQRCSKANRFGINDIQEGQPDSNRDRLLQEANDLFAALELQFGCNIIHLIDRKQIEAKKQRIEQYLEFSKKCGTLQ